MKKILIATNLLFASVLYFQNCTNSPEVIIKPGNSKQNWHCLNYADSTFNGISFGTAGTMFNCYGNYQYTKITNNNQPNMEDSKSVWFSLDLIKKFIYKIEDTLNAKGFDPTTRLGIRFYFAAYPDSDQMKLNPFLNKLPLTYAKHHTLFLVPTYDIVSANAITHQDFNAFAPLSQSKKMVANPHINEQNVKTFSAVMLSGFGVTNDVYIQNHGEIGPPPQVVPGATFN